MITRGETKSQRTGVYIAAAAAVSLAGVIHLMLGAGSLRFSGSGMAILFTVGGLLQIFWIIPMVRRWGPVWYAVGIAGNVALFVLWLITRYPGNPFMPRGFGFPAGFNIQWIEEGAQIAYIGLAAAILAMRSRATATQGSEERPAKSRKGIAILAGIVAALILFSLFVLPALMLRPAGGPRGAPPGGLSPQGQGAQQAHAGGPLQQPPPP